MPAQEPFSAWAIPIDFAALGAAVDIYGYTIATITTLIECHADPSSYISRLPGELLNAIMNHIEPDAKAFSVPRWKQMAACRARDCYGCGGDRSKMETLMSGKLEEGCWDFERSPPRYSSAQRSFSRAKQVCHGHPPEPRSQLY